MTSLKDEREHHNACRACFCFETSYAALIHAVLLAKEDVTGGKSHAVCRLIDSKHIELCIDAEDTHALRAALNSWLRLFSVAAEMCDLAEV